MRGACETAARPRSSPIFSTHRSRRRTPTLIRSVRRPAPPPPPPASPSPGATAKTSTAGQPWLPPSQPASHRHQGRAPSPRAAVFQEPSPSPSDASSTAANTAAAPSELPPAGPRASSLIRRWREIEAVGPTKPRPVTVSAADPGASDCDTGSLRSRVRSIVKKLSGASSVPEEELDDVAKSKLSLWQFVPMRDDSQYPLPQAARSPRLMGPLVGQSNASTIPSVNARSGMACLMPLLRAFLADAYLITICHHRLHPLRVVHRWPCLPKGVKFDPSGLDLIWHLLANHGKSRIKAHCSLTNLFQQLRKMKASATLIHKNFQVSSEMEVYRISSTGHLRPTTMRLGSVER